MSLQNQRVVVVGGSSGIGLAVAQAAAAQGARVVLASRSQAKLDAALATLGAGHDAVALDFTVEKQVRRLFERLGALDHLVVTAAQGVAGPFLELEPAKVREVFEGKFLGQYLCARFAAPLIRPSGSITLFSSLAAHRAMPGLSAMAAMNGAVEALARTLAVELAPTRVNVVAPGVVDTPAHRWMPDAQRRAWFDGLAAMLPARRVGRPEDVAQAVLFLMTSSYTTGHVLRIDGGESLL